MDEAEKKRLINEMKRIFQREYTKLIEEIERLKKEFATDDEQPWYRELVLSTVDVAIVLRALQKSKSTLESFLEIAKPGSTGYFDLDTQCEHTKELIGFFEEVLYGRASLIFKRST